MSSQTATFTVQDVIDQVRGVINRVEPYASDGFTEATMTDASNVLDSAGRTFHDDWFIEQVDHAQRVIAQKCKAFHLDSLVTEHKGGIDRYNSLNDKLRTLHGRIERIGAECTSSACDYITARYRGIAEHEMLEQAGRSATACYPAYTYDDGILQVYPKPDTSDDDAIGVKVDYVAHPTQLTATTDTLEVDARFLGPIVAYVASKAFAMMNQTVQADSFWNIYLRRIQPLTRKIMPNMARSYSGPMLAELENEIE